MPTFVTESALPPRWGAFILPIPSIQWFADSVLQALAEMTIRENWTTDSEALASLATNYASEMLARYKLTGFNPFPEGMIFPFGGALAPDGYLLCDGSSYLTTDYPELFAQIGYYFGGSGDNFSVPNLINRIPVGSGDLYDLADVGGTSEVTLTTDEMPSHSHSDTGHTHLYTPPGTTILAVAPGEAPVSIPSILPSSTGTGYANITSAGEGLAHTNMQPFQALTYIIYAGR